MANVSRTFNGPVVPLDREDWAKQFSLRGYPMPLGSERAAAEETRSANQAVLSLMAELEEAQHRAQEALMAYRTMRRAKAVNPEAGSWQAMYDAIARQAGVSTVGFDPDSAMVAVTTKPLQTPVLEDGSIRDLGSFVIRIPLPGSGDMQVRFEGRDWQDLNPNSPYPHPHVYEDGRPCLGLIGAEQVRLFGLQRYDLLVDLAIRFLESVNYSSLLGDPYTWPVAQNSPVKGDACFIAVTDDPLVGEGEVCDFCDGRISAESPEEHSCTCCPFCLERARGIPWTYPAGDHRCDEAQVVTNHHCNICGEPTSAWELYYLGRRTCTGDEGHVWCDMDQEFEDEDYEHPRREAPPEAPGPRPAPLAQQQDQMHERLLRQVRGRRQPPQESGNVTTNISN